MLGKFIPIQLISLSLQVFGEAPDRIIEGAFSVPCFNMPSISPCLYLPFLGKLSY